MGAVCRKIYELCTDPRLNSHPLRRLQAITAAGHLAAGAADEATKATLVHILLAQTPAGALPPRSAPWRCLLWLLSLFIPLPACGVSCGAQCAACVGDVEDVHFTVGEALCLAFGATAATPAAILREPFTTLADHRRAHPDAPADAAPPRAPAPRAAILAATLRNAASSNADVRCAAAVWLLCLLTFCAAAPEVAACLGAAQDALLALLGDQSELTQEVASRGLAVAHDAGDAATRERLVTALVATLSGQGRPTKAVKVDGDTQARRAPLTTPPRPPAPAAAKIALHCRCLSPARWAAVAAAAALRLTRSCVPWPRTSANQTWYTSSWTWRTTRRR